MMGYKWLLFGKHGNKKSPNLMEVSAGKIIELNAFFPTQPCLMTPEGRFMVI